MFIRLNTIHYLNINQSLHHIHVHTSVPTSINYIIIYNYTIINQSPKHTYIIWLSINHYIIYAVLIRLQSINAQNIRPLFDYQRNIKIYTRRSYIKQSKKYTSVIWLLIKYWNIYTTFIDLQSIPKTNVHYWIINQSLHHYLIINEILKYIRIHTC